MTAEDVVLAISNALTQTHVPYMAVGAFVGIYYGIGRTTEDADFLLQVSDPDLGALRAALGPDFTVDSQAKLESITLGTYYVAKHVASDFGIDLFLLRDDPHDQLSFSRRRKITFDRGESYIPAPEDFLITKLRWFKLRQRPKDIEDVKNVLAVQQGKLDLAYIRQWCNQHGTCEIFEMARASIPPLPPA